MALMVTPTRTRENSQRPLQIGIFVSVLATAFEGIAVATAMPAVAADLGKIHLYAWAFSLFTIGMLAATVISGRYADLRGPAPVLVIGGVTFVAGLIIAGLAPAMEQLLIGRLIQGLGAGGLNVALYVVIALAFDERRRAKVITLVSAAWVLPALIGPMIAGWVTEVFSWHWVFLGVLPFVAFAAVLVTGPARRMHAAHEQVDAAATNPVPLWTGVALAAAAIAVQYAGQRASRPEGRDLIALGSLLVGVAILALALPRLMPPGLLTFRPGMPSVIASRALIAGSFFGAEAFIPLMLVQLRGLDLKLAGTMLTIGSLGWFLGSWLQSRDWVHIPRHLLIVLGTVSALIGVGGSAAFPFLPHAPIWLVGVVWTFAGLGMGFAIASTGLAVMTLSTKQQQGRNSSALQSGESLGASVLTGLAGVVFAALHPLGNLPITFGAVLATMALSCLLAVFSSLRIGAINSPEALG